ncbi:MAG: phosphoribosyltransferase [Muribaculaceae bacterium]|nr:phosphoribosyltransferase [Muribaculaceae bacterium]
MRRRSKIVRMDQWDTVAKGPKLLSDRVPRCDLAPREALHRIGSMYYISQFRRSKEGLMFREIKSSGEHAGLFADAACKFLAAFIGNTAGWCVITTPRRRHADGFHFATEVCRRISGTLGIPFYVDALQCVNHDRLHPDFMLLRPIAERRVIVYDDIITTGSTLLATNTQLGDRDMVLNLISISNR